MVTGASTASLMIVLIDASRRRVQSRRHAFIASLLRVPIFVATNKMDLVDYSKDVAKILLRISLNLYKLELTDVSLSR